MIGCIAHAANGEEAEVINLGNDNELEVCRWVPVEDIREALEKGVVTLEGGDEMRLPPRSAIAGVLLRAVVEEIPRPGEQLGGKGKGEGGAKI